jgi:isocitrate dehydrogenase
MDKTQREVAKKNQKFAVLQQQDYDGDGISDTVVTKEGKIYCFNGFFTKILIIHYVVHF